jgi:hypothetical protein
MSELWLSGARGRVLLRLGTLTPANHETPCLDEVREACLAGCVARRSGSRFALHAEQNPPTAGGRLLGLSASVTPHAPIAAYAPKPETTDAMGMQIRATTDRLYEQ